MQRIGPKAVRVESAKKARDNTVGRRLNINYAYIAGFLDGDGSLMLQVKKRNDCTRGWRFMASIVLYQDSRHDEPLQWIRNTLGIGYVSERKDGMTELRINGFATIERILTLLQPYVRFKKVQVEQMLHAIKILQGKPQSQLTRGELNKLLQIILTVQKHNYRSHQKRATKTLRTILGLTP